MQTSILLQHPGLVRGGTRARWAAPWRAAALVLALCLPGLGAAAACDPGMAC